MLAYFKGATPLELMYLNQMSLKEEVNTVEETDSNNLRMQTGKQLFAESSARTNTSKVFSLDTKNEMKWD